MEGRLLDAGWDVIISIIAFFFVTIRSVEHGCVATHDTAATGWVALLHLLLVGGHNGAEKDRSVFLKKTFLRWNLVLFLERKY